VTRRPPPRVEQLWEQALDADPLIANQNAALAGTWRQAPMRAGIVAV
jgi:hypothetical protein